jgi:hypothetical protein
MAACLLAITMTGSAGSKPRVDWSYLAAKHPDAFPVVVETLEVRRIFHLDPMATWSNPPATADRFHKWVVVGTAALESAASGDALIRSLREMVDTPQDGVAACFEPHHGAILSNDDLVFELVLCLRCSRYVVYTPDGKVVWGGSFATGKNETALWNRVFREAGLNPEGRNP